MSDVTLHERLRALGLIGAADAFDDLIALATKKRWGPPQILEHVADIEERERARRGLERRLSRSHLGRFKTIADYDWNWPTSIDRPLVESAVGLHFLGAARNVVLVAPQGLGKTMFAQNIAHQAIVAGHSVLFTRMRKRCDRLRRGESARAGDVASSIARLAVDVVRVVSSVRVKVTTIGDELERLLAVRAIHERTIAGVGSSAA